MRTLSNLLLSLLSRENVYKIGVLLLPAIAFVIYIPSLKSGLIYDARAEILKEGFITSSSNIPYIFSPHILSANLMLATRPGHMFYLMVIALLCGRHPFGYHLCSNILHAVNVLMLFMLLRRLMEVEQGPPVHSQRLHREIAVACVCLIFAFHPICVESVAEVSYSSSLLVAFFTFITVLAATYYNCYGLGASVSILVLGALCSFCSVTCKESGITTTVLLIIYWLLYRRREHGGAWTVFCLSSVVGSGAFLAARFYLARHDDHPLEYLGGSFGESCLIQPRIWVFMIGQMFWPTKLSADYMPENITVHSTLFASFFLCLLLALQALLSYKSRLGALGVALYWLGLATVSNFVPLYRFLADRFYYLPLAGCMMQVLAVFLILNQWRWGAYLGSSIMLAVLLAAFVPLVSLTMARQSVFSNESSFWCTTVQVSPSSPMAHNGVAIAFFQARQMDSAISEFKTALRLDPESAEINDNLGSAFSEEGRIEDAEIQYRKALRIRADYPEAHNNLGLLLFGRGRVKEAICEFRTALGLEPYYDEAYNNLGVALLRCGQTVEARKEFEDASKINPQNSQAYFNLGNICFQDGQLHEALANYRSALQINPDYKEARDNLTNVELVEKTEADIISAHVHNSCGANLAKEGNLEDALFEFRTAIKLNPESSEAHTNEGNILFREGRIDEATADFRQALNANPGNAEAMSKLGIILCQKGQINAAISEFNDALKFNAEDVKLRNNLGVALVQTGLIKQGILQFREALRIDPACIEAKSNLERANSVLIKKNPTSTITPTIYGT